MRQLLGLIALLLLALALSYEAVFAAFGRYLVVEDPLQRAEAIAILGGATPYREVEGARLYREGWAPIVVIARAGRSTADDRAIEALGVALQDRMEVRKEVLQRLGVPGSAIVVAPGLADASLDELELFSRALPGAERVILVTSNYHTRRISLYWSYLFADSPRAVVRATNVDGFDPNGWWRSQATILNAAREAMGLTNYALGFPVAQRADGSLPP